MLFNLLWLPGLLVPPSTLSRAWHWHYPTVYSGTTGTVAYL